MRPTRTTLTISTKTGLQTVQAWLVEDMLAIHKSWMVGGWTITHLASRNKVWSRIQTKALAIETAHRLLEFPGCDWSAEAPIPPGHGGEIMAYLRSVPLYRRNRAPPIGAEPTRDPEPYQPSS